LLIYTKYGSTKINNSDKILYNKFNFKNEKITSINLIWEKDTLNFFTKNNQNLTFERNEFGYKSLNLSINPKKNTSKFDFELCKKNKMNIIINFNDVDFKRVYKALIIVIENPKGRDMERHNMRIAKRKFRHREKELKRYFKNADFTTLVFDNKICIGRNN
jgi:hypothetical protein